jgi:uncharacterized protein
MAPRPGPAADSSAADSTTGGTAADSTAADSTAADSTAADSTAADSTTGDTAADSATGDTAADSATGDSTTGDTAADSAAGDSAAADSTARDTAARDTPKDDTKRAGAGRPDPEAGRAGRDRDPAGRARNARPRDGLGRPLDRDSAGEPTMPEGVVLPPAAALDSAQHLLDAGRPFHAHEVLEASWKSAPAAERDLWQGLAQLAVGLTHARRGNPAGAAALLRRGAARVSAYIAASPHGVDAAGLAATATRLAARIERTGLAGLSESDLTLRLRP